MTTRPTPERLKEIRDEVHAGYWKGPGQELFTAIDTLTAENELMKRTINGRLESIEKLTAERDKYHDDFMATARRECAFEKERDQWRAGYEKLREALEYMDSMARSVNNAAAWLAKDKYFHCLDEMESKARKALSLPRPGSSG